MLPPRTDFPAGFTFGAATSAYQIEGTAGAGPSHWDTFAATPGNIMDDSDGSRACDHLRLWPQDLDLIRDAGFDGYRFSTSWARVMPDGVVTLNVPSAVMANRQPRAKVLSRWWLRHRQQRFWQLVGPPSACGTTWSRSVQATELRQPGCLQVRSRARRKRRWAGLGR